jgi:hypothetical protein
VLGGCWLLGTVADPAQCCSSMHLQGQVQWPNRAILQCKSPCMCFAAGVTFQQSRKKSRVLLLAQPADRMAQSTILWAPNLLDPILIKQLPVCACTTCLR